MAVLSFITTLLLQWQLEKRDAGIYTMARRAFIKTLIVYAAQVWLIVHLLSPFDLLIPAAVNLSFALFILAALTLIVVFYRRGRVLSLPARKPTREITVHLLILSLYIAAPILLLCLLYPPKMADCMNTYMPKIEYWAQNKNVAPFPFLITSAVTGLQPFAHYVMLCLRLSFGSVRFDFLYDFTSLSSLIGMFCAGTLLLKRFGFGWRWQLLFVYLLLSSALITAESFTSQYDLMPAFFTLASLYFLHRFIDREETGTAPLVWSGLAAGLSLLTKVYVAAVYLPFCLWFLIRYLREGKHGAGRIVLSLCVFFLLIGIVIAPFYYSSSRFNRISGAGEGSAYTGIASGGVNKLTQTDLSLHTLIRNTLRNLSVPDGKHNTTLAAIGDRVSTALTGHGIDDNSVGLGFPYQMVFDVTSSLRSWHFIFIALSLALAPYLFARWKRIPLVTRVYVICGLIAYVLFTIGVDWAPYQGRYYPVVVGAGTIGQLMLIRSLFGDSGRIKTVSCVLLFIVPLLYAGMIVKYLFDPNPLLSLLVYPVIILLTLFAAPRLRRPRIKTFLPFYTLMMIIIVFPSIYKDESKPFFTRQLLAPRDRREAFATTENIAILNEVIDRYDIKTVAIAYPGDGPRYPYIKRSFLEKGVRFYEINTSERISQSYGRNSVDPGLTADAVLTFLGNLTLGENEIESVTINEYIHPYSGSADVRLIVLKKGVVPFY